MAISNRGTNLPGIAAGADLSAQQHHFISINSSGEAVLTGAGAQIDAVLENNPLQGSAASLMGPGSVAKVVAGAAIAVGASVSSDASGEAVTSATTNYIAGTALNAVGGANEIVSVWLTMPGRLA